MKMRSIGLVAALILGVMPSRARAAIEATTYQGRAAFRLSDGKTEAIIVPALGRVMRYGFVHSANVLWNAPPELVAKFKSGSYANWGGDKTWPAPQTFWPALSGTSGWPPDSAWDGTPQRAELDDERVRTTSEVSAFNGARIVREYGFNARGELEIAQTVKKVVGTPVVLSIWSVTQIVPPDAIFLPLRANSIYKDNFDWIQPPTIEPRELWTSFATRDDAKHTPDVLRVRPSMNTNFKIGVDADVAGVVSVKDGVAFCERAAKPKGDYPDGAVGGAGFPVELFNLAQATIQYNELEILSPLRTFKNGARWKHTVTWSLHRLPSNDATSPETAHAVAELLAL